MKTKTQRHKDTKTHRYKNKDTKTKTQRNKDTKKYRHKDKDIETKTQRQNLREKLTIPVFRNALLLIIPLLMTGTRVR